MGSRGGSVPRNSLSSADKKILEAKTYFTGNGTTIEEGQDFPSAATLIARVGAISMGTTVPKAQKDELRHIAVALGELDRIEKKMLQDTRTELELLKMTAQAAEEALAERDEYEGSAPATRVSVEVLQETVEELAGQMKDLKEMLSKGHGDRGPSQPDPSQTDTLHASTPPGSFSAAARKGLGASPRQNAVNVLAAQRAHARREVMNHQVLVNIPDAESRRKLEEGGEAQIISRARAIVKRIINPPDEKKEDYDIRSVKFIPSRGVLLEIRSASAAEQLREKDLGSKFAKEWSPDANIPPRVVTVIANFVPLSFDPAGTNAVAHVETGNGLKAGVIHKMAWCRFGPFPAGQKTGLLKVQVTSRAAANHLVSRGMTIEHKCVSVRIDHRGPLRCHGCQRYGHTAERCRNKVACGKCGGEHRTSDCDQGDKTYCVSCKTDDHTSLDKECPQYKRQIELIELRDPDANMPLFTLTQQERQVELLDGSQIDWGFGTAMPAMEDSQPTGNW